MVNSRIAAVTPNEDVAADKMCSPTLGRRACGKLRAGLRSCRFCRLVIRCCRFVVDDAYSTCLSAGLCSSTNPPAIKLGQCVDRLLGVVSVGLDDQFRSLRGPQRQQVEDALGVDPLVPAQDLDPRLDTCIAVRASVSAGRACNPSGFTMTTARVTGEVLMTKCS